MVEGLGHLPITQNLHIHPKCQTRRSGKSIPIRAKWSQTVLGVVSPRFGNGCGVSGKPLTELVLRTKTVKGGATTFDSQSAARNFADNHGAHG